MQNICFAYPIFIAKLKVANENIIHISMAISNILTKFAITKVSFSRRILLTYKSKSASHSFFLFFPIIFIMSLFALSTEVVSSDLRYIKVVLSESCPIALLIVPSDTLLA